MYIVDSIINGTSVRTVNYVHFHGLLTNRDETYGPRRPGELSIPLRCIYNVYDQPRITYFKTRPILPVSIAAKIPLNQYFQFIPLQVDKYVSLKYDADFDYIYSSRGYRRDHDGFVNSLVSDAKELSTAYNDCPQELVLHYTEDIKTFNAKVANFEGVEGHQAENMKKSMAMSHGLVDTYKIVDSEEGVAFCDEYFEIIRPYLRDDYFCWQRYVEK